MMTSTPFSRPLPPYVAASRERQAVTGHSPYPEYVLTPDSSQPVPGPIQVQPLLDFSNLSPGFNTSLAYNNSGGGGFNSSLGNDNSSLLGPEPLVLSDGAKGGLIVLYTLTTLLSISGNVLVVLVFARGRRCRTDIRPFLINLAVSDLVMAVFCMPFTFTFVMMDTWLFSKPMCPVVLFMQHLSVSASVFTNVAIGFDRFLVVMYPLRSRVTTARAKYVLCAIWTCATGLSSVQLVVGRANEWPDGTVTCDEVWGSPTARRTFTLFVLVITYVIPLLMLAAAYTVVGMALWTRTTPGNADSTRDLQQLRAKRKVVKMLVLVVTMFGVCWLPLHTFFLVIDFNPDINVYGSPEQERFFVGLYYSVHWLAMSNSFANPIIYSFTNDSFRADLAYLFYVVFPFCKCLKQLANRKLSVSMRDRRSTIRMASPAQSPHHPKPSLHADQREAERRNQGDHNGRDLTRSSRRVYLPVTRDRTTVESKGFVVAQRSSDGSASSDKTPLKTTATYV